MSQGLLVHNYRKLWRKKRMQNGMCRVFESAPAANRDSDSYKQPLLASTGHDRIDATPARTEPRQS
jgi:hypothetical protein